MANRSRGELIAIIMRGEAVILPDGRVVTRIEDLPDAVTLAGNDIVAKQQALGDLQRQQEIIAAQIADAQRAVAADSAAPQSGPHERSDEVAAPREPLAKLYPLGPDVAGALINAGLDTPEKIANATDEEIDAIQGIGPATVAKIRELLK